MKIQEIQTQLAQQQLDGWLFFDFHHRNSIAYRTLELADDLIATRRWFYYIPSRGEPAGLVSALESHNLDSLPGQKLIYRTWEDRRNLLAQILPKRGRVAMEFSPLNAIPYVALVDAGTVDLVRSLGVEVVSSADLVQLAISQWGLEQWRQHEEASLRLMAIKDQAFAATAERVQAGQRPTDFEIQQLMVEEYRKADLVSDDPPIVATNERCSNPHYLPTEARQTEIREGDVLLIDFWAKLAQPNSVYADHTWMAFVGREVPKRVEQVFGDVAMARDRAIDFVRESFAEGRKIRGWEVDDVARNWIAGRGFGEYFIHRTGHNIDKEVHGEGANMDNYETHDERLVLERTCFSIEPGIYLPEFGVRSEVDVFIAGPNDIRVTGGPAQRAVTALPA
jgi:Xaa-Pro aminopeptidase